MDANKEREMRQFKRVKVQSLLVSLTQASNGETITGFMRDISEGGLKIQKLSTLRQLNGGIFACDFTLPGTGKIASLVEMVGMGYAEEKFSEHLLRFRFWKLGNEDKLKIRSYVRANLDDRVESV